MLKTPAARTGIETVLDGGTMQEVLAIIRRYPSIRDEEWFLDRRGRFSVVKAADELFLEHARQLDVEGFLQEVSEGSESDVLFGYADCESSPVAVLAWILRYRSGLDDLRRVAVKNLDGKLDCDLQDSGIHAAINSEWTMEHDRHYRAMFERLSRRIPEITVPQWSAAGFRSVRKPP